MLRHILIFFVLSTVTSAGPRRTTIETVVETVTRRVVHYLQPHCQCEQVAECKREAIDQVSECFEECDGELESFHSQTRRELTSCFTPHIQNAVDADECLFKEMKDFCRTDDERKFIMPSNFSESVGFDLQMAPPADQIPDVPMFKRALEQFNVFQDFFGCAKKCVHREMTACFAKKRCAVLIPPTETLKPMFDKCNAHTPQMSLSLLTTCQCLAHRRGVSSLYGICPIISNPTFIEN